MLQTFFKTIEELHLIVSVDRELELDNIQPDINYVEQLYIKPLLGTAFFESLLDKYQNDNATESEAKLIDRIQAASANLAVWKYTPRGNVKIGNTGLVAFHSEHEKPAFQWQVVAFQNALRDRGFDLLDQMVLFLEDHASDYPAWAGSEVYTATKNYFINTASEFDNIVSIGCSRRLFIKIRPTMARVEEFVITPVISQPLFDQLKEQIKTDTISPENAKLLVLVQKAVAHQTMAAAIVLLSLNINADGIFVIDNDNTKTIDASKPAADERLSVLIRQHEDHAVAYTGKIKKLINKNPEADYPEYFNSEDYVAVTTPFQFQNKAENGVYFL